MAAPLLVPQASWFRFAMLCNRIDALPRRSQKGAGRLLDLPDSCVLPNLKRLDGRESWSEVRAAWNPGGLAVAVQVNGKLDAPRRGLPESDTDAVAGIQVWVDTRDTRDVHRATRFCQRFAFRLEAGDGSEIIVKSVQKPIPRAMAEAPKAKPESMPAWAERRGRPEGWQIEVFLQREALHGFDPETNRRLGLMVQTTNPRQGDEFLGGLGREFPVESDPSFWPVLELREG